MDFSINFDTVKSGWSIVYIEGVTCYNLKIIVYLFPGGDSGFLILGLQIYKEEFNLLIVLGYLLFFPYFSKSSP